MYKTGKFQAGWPKKANVYDVLVNKNIEIQELQKKVEHKDELIHTVGHVALKNQRQIVDLIKSQNAREDEIKKLRKTVLKMSAENQKKNDEIIALKGEPPCAPVKRTNKKQMKKPVKQRTFQFKCEFPGCDKAYEKKKSFMRHLLRHKAKYNCPVCELNFGQISDLNRHLVRHTGRKPFRCDYCGLQFSQKSNLKRHMAVHLH